MIFRPQQKKILPNSLCENLFCIPRMGMQMDVRLIFSPVKVIRIHVHLRLICLNVFFFCIIDMLMLLN